MRSSVALLLLAGCASVPSTGPVILWEEEPQGFVGECVALTQVPHQVDGRGIILERNQRTHEVLIDILGALRLKRNVIANNLANVDTTSAEQAQVMVEGQDYVRHLPFRRKDIVVSRNDRLRLIAEVVDDPSEFRVEQDPSHPHRVQIPGDDMGKVVRPNVNPILEMVDMIAATKSYGQILEILKAWR